MSIKDSIEGDLDNEYHYLYFISELFEPINLSVKGMRIRKEVKTCQIWITVVKQSRSS